MGLVEDSVVALVVGLVVAMAVVGEDGDLMGILAGRF